jgi:DNA segregation ATPase FtsK/SpoIIIE-like protein
VRWRSLPAHRGVQAAASTIAAVLTGLMTRLLTSHWTWALGLALVVVSLTWALLEWTRSVSDPQTASGQTRRISVIQKARLLRSRRLTGVRLWAADADVAVTQKVGTAQNVHITGVDADAAP